MTDLKLKNDSDRLQLGMCFSSFGYCSLAVLLIYCIMQSLSNWSLSRSHCHTQWSQTLHFILSRSLTISLSHLFIHSIIIILIPVWLNHSEYIFLLICSVTKFWQTYPLISVINTRISLSISLLQLEAFYWAFIPTSACTLNYIFTHSFKDKPTDIFHILFSHSSLLHLPLKWKVNSTQLLWTSDNEIQYKDLVLT